MTSGLPGDPVAGLLADLHRRLAPLDAGEVASYIPALAAADPRAFGIALSTLDGRVEAAGDADVAFTIQSISKPFVYGLALADLGPEAVLAQVGVEPSGEPFNAISLEPGTGRPANPMINAGAILTTSLLVADTPEARWSRVLDGLSAFAGRRLEVDEGVFRSEDETGDRNRALAWLMRGAGSLEAEVEASVRTYFRQCAVLVTARDLAVMAATLANGGVNPVSGVSVVSEDVATRVLTVMATCGMYDGSGEWLVRVGLPAKSGVAGGLLAVMPAQVGIGCFSPPLDAQGNSVRGVAACTQLSERYGLHLMRVPGRTTPLYRATTAAGGAVLVRGLHGDIGFAAAERAARSLPADRAGVRWLVLDLGPVGTLHPAGEALLGAVIEALAGEGIGTVIADSWGVRWFPDLPHEADLEAAIAWAAAGG